MKPKLLAALALVPVVALAVVLILKEESRSAAAELQAQTTAQVR